MHFQSVFLASAAAAGAAANSVNRTLTNGWGSTPSDRHYINHTQALEVLNAGVTRSLETGVFENIAVLDPSAHLVAFIHMDNSYYGSIDMSQKKAKTVVLFNGQFPSHGLYNRTQPGPGNDLWSLQSSNDGLVVFPGGQPIYDHDGYFIGAVGVSGGTVEQDVDVAVHAAKAVGTTLELPL